MSRRPWILIAVITAVLLLVGVMPAGASPRVPRFASRGLPELAPPAQAPTERAFSISRNDGNDVPGPLDLASMRISRGKSNDTVAFSAHGAVSNSAIDPSNGNFAILIDVNDDRDYDYGQYVFFAAGKLRGTLVNLNTNNLIDRTVPTSRTGAKGFRQVVQRAKIHSPGTYRFAVYGFYQASPCSKQHPCIDTIPNRYPLIPLDHRAPTSAWDSWETYSGDASDDLTSPIEFHFDDDQFGTGVKGWEVQRRKAGASTWVTVDHGKTLNPTVSVPGTEGSTYDLRTIVTDRQANRKVSTIKRTTFPYDDRDGAIIYAGTGVENNPADAFLQTTTTLSQAATATLSFTGTQVCVLGGPTANPAAADFDVDTGAFTGSFAESNTTVAREHFTCLDVPSGAHTMVITVTSVEPFVIDGFYVMP